IRSASRLINALRLFSHADQRRRVRRSRCVLRKLRSFEGEHRCACVFAYMRQVDPLLFEELVLSALEDAGAFVLRNRRYSGDGGVDGMAWVNGIGWCAVPAKRYAAHVSNEHVAAFPKLVAASRPRAGLFVHTGRTGTASYQALRGSRLLLLSGERFARLILDRYLSAGPGVRI
ncbi:MAG TPA: restriction endonuclease, partial [Acidiferrobacterales bacterium]|nr:restriction endonuclease [Acidiferrobacterales bacterium]